jgi:hypothetical protein
VRIPKGWYCASLRLQQVDQTVILYTFLQPEIAQGMPRFNEWFVQLHRREDTPADKSLDPRTAARKARLRQFEDERWHDGAELSVSDFLAVMSLVDQHGRPGPGF